MESLAVGAAVGYVLFVIGGLILGLCIAIAPLMCWIHLSHLRAEQAEERKLIKELLDELRSHRL